MYYLLLLLLSRVLLDAWKTFCCFLNTDIILTGYLYASLETCRIFPSEFRNCVSKQYSALTLTAGKLDTR
jgi:hypothetical protein